MKKLNLIIAFALAGCLMACGDKQETKDNTTDTTASEVKEEKKEPVTTSVGIDTKTSKVNWQRTKKAEGQKQTIKLGGKDVSVDIGSMEVTTSGAITFKDGKWTLVDGKLQEGFFQLDMLSIQGLTVNNNKQVEFGSPEYLHTDKFPTADLKLTTFAPDTTQKDKNYKLSGELTLKGNTQPVEIFANMQMNDKGEPASLKGDLIIDGVAWKLAEPKTGKVTYDQLKLDILIESAKEAQVN